MGATNVFQRHQKAIGGGWADGFAHSHSKFGLVSDATAAGLLCSKCDWGLCLKETSAGPIYNNAHLKETILNSKEVLKIQKHFACTKTAAKKNFLETALRLAVDYRYLIVGSP